MSEDGRSVPARTLARSVWLRKHWSFHILLYTARLAPQSECQFLVSSRPSETPLGQKRGRALSLPWFTLVFSHL